MAAFTDGNMRASQIFAANSMKITKLKVKKGQKISKGCLLCFYKDDNDTLQRFKSHEIGTITDIFVKDGDNVDKGTALFAWEGCNHPTVMKDMCADCGADLRVENSTAGNRKEEVSASVAMVHSIPELIVSEQYAKELGKADEERLLKTRKLVLLVDLDQTLIHTTNDNIPANLKDVHHYQLWHGKQLLWYHTRLRPHTQSFLEKISTLFELHICTFGSRIYAHTIAKIIDPEGKYFSHRILSRDECFNAQAKTANLKALFPNGDSMVCIIDDREDVWHFSPNLIHVKPYRFFQGTADINAPPGLTKTEQDSEPMVHRVRKISVSSTGSNEDKSETDKSEKSEENNEGKSNDSKNGPTVEDKVSDLKDSKTSENEKKDNDSNESKNEGDNEKSVSPMEVEGEGDIKTAVSASHNPIETDGVGKTKVEESDKNSDSNIVDSSKGDTENNDKQNVDDSAVKDDLSDKKSAETEAENKNDVDKKCSGDKAIDKKDETNDQEEELIEWDDEDDYLLHLEEILKNIHSTFYKFQDDFVKKQTDKSENSDKTNVDDGTAPSLKNLIPYIKKKVLKGCNLVFSGVIPTNMTPDKSRAYIVAKSLGATVQTEFRTKENEKDSTNFTTHLVAARAGTQKVRTAMKYKHINKVNADWLWSCVERWERVEEVLFPLTALLECEQGRDSPDIIEQQKKAASKRKRPYDSDSDKNKSESKRSKQNGKDVDDDDNVDDVDNESDKKPDNFAMSYNPMLAFSDDDLAYMDKEVENELENDDDDASSEEDDVREERIRNQVLKKVPELVESSSEDSLCADLPRGWGLRKKMSPRSSSDDEMKGSDSPERIDISPEYESETDQDKFEKIMDAFGPESENTDDEYAESVGSVDEEIAEAVMKEFLS